MPGAEVNRAQLGLHGADINKTGLGTTCLSSRMPGAEINKTRLGASCLSSQLLGVTCLSGGKPGGIRNRAAKQARTPRNMPRTSARNTSEQQLGACGLSKGIRPTRNILHTVPLGAQHRAHGNSLPQNLGHSGPRPRTAHKTRVAGIRYSLRATTTGRVGVRLPLRADNLTTPSRSITENVTRPLKTLCLQVRTGVLGVRWPHRADNHSSRQNTWMQHLSGGGRRPTTGRTGPKGVTTLGPPKVPGPKARRRGGNTPLTNIRKERRNRGQKPDPPTTLDPLPKQCRLQQAKRLQEQPGSPSLRSRGAPWAPRLTDGRSTSSPPPSRPRQITMQPVGRGRSSRRHEPGANKPGATARARARA